VNFGIRALRLKGTHSTAFVRPSPGCDHPGAFVENSYDLRDTVSKNIQSHALRMGFDFIDEQNNNNLSGALDPSIPTSVFGISRMTRRSLKD